MYCQINAGGLRGLESYVALVEVDVSRGLPCFEMVGLLAGEVKEARERIRVALKNAGRENNGEYFSGRNSQGRNRL